MSVRSVLAHRPLRRLLPLAAAVLLLAPTAVPSAAATGHVAAPGRHLTAEGTVAPKHVDVRKLPRVRSNTQAVRRSAPMLPRDHAATQTTTSVRTPANPAVATATLTIVIHGSGAVSSSPAGIACPAGACAFDFAAGTSVTLTAAPGSSSYFAGWDVQCGAAPVCNVTVNNALTLEAWFETAGPAAADMSAAPVTQTTSFAPGVADITGAPCTGTPCLEPPDPWIAVGPNNVVQATNVSIRISDRSGNLQHDVALPDFFLEPAGQINGGDPRLIWDSLHSRWLASEMTYDATTGHLYLAVSDTADPSAGWRIYRWDRLGAIYDYPGLGISSNQVAVSWNAFSLNAGVVGSYLGAGFLAADAASLIAEVGSLSYGTSSDDLSVFTWRPTVSLTYGNDLPLVVGIGIGPAGLDLGFARLTGTMAAKTMDLTATTDLTQASGGLPLGDPPAALAFGTSGAVQFDARPTDAVAENGHLWVAASAGCTPTGDTAARSCVRVVEVASSGTPSVIQDFSVGKSGDDTFGGGIGVNGAGSAFVAWSESNATVRGPISTYAAYRASGDPANTLHQPILVAPGAGTYAGTRWGDYLGVARDPNDASKVFVANEVSTAAGDWATHIDALSEAGSPVFAGATYKTVTPSRLLDTRNGTGLAGAFSSGVARTFQVTGLAGVPANAVAVTGNLTVTAQSRAGYVALGPVATNSPTTSTLNFPLGDNRANGVTVPLGAGGTLSATYITGRTGDHTALIFDVTGYFVPDASGTTYATVTPTRLLDTRVGNGLSGAFSSGVARTFQVTGRGGVPANAVAVTGNLTVTAQTRAGYVALGPVATNSPTTSTLNFPLGDARANGVTVPLGAGGTLSATYITGRLGDRTALIFDVTGYFVPDATGATYMPVSPSRLLDTRNGTGLSGAFSSGVSRTFGASGQGGVPANAVGVTGNLTVTQQTRAGYVALGPVATNSPTTSTLNFPLGDNRANGVTVPLRQTDGTLSATYITGRLGDRTALIFDVTGYFVH